MTVAERIAKLGRIQRSVLEGLYQHHGWHNRRCGWNWDTPRNTERIMETLVSRGLVTKAGNNDLIVYSLTDEVREVFDEAKRLRRAERETATTQQQREDRLRAQEMRRRDHAIGKATQWPIECHKEEFDRLVQEFLEED